MTTKPPTASAGRHVSEASARPNGAEFEPPGTGERSAPPRESRSGGPIFHQRVLAAELRALRTEAALTHIDVAQRLGWPQAKVSKIEGAKQAVTVEAVMALTEICQAGTARRERLLDLARRARERPWWQGYTDALPAGLATYVGLESEAETVAVFGGESIPEVVQTERYARARVSVSGGDDSSPAERRLALMLERKRRFDSRADVSLEVMVSESAVHRVVGPDELVHEQLSGLVDWARPGTTGTLRVVPFRAGPLPCAAPFSVLAFREQVHPDSVFLSGPMDHQLISEQGEVARYQQVWSWLSDRALSPEETVDVLSERMQEVVCVS